jgi:carboxyl-terminal processing protease
MLRFRHFAVPATIIALLAAPALCVAREEAPKKPEKSVASTYELLNLFGDVFERVRQDYVEEVSDEKLIESALNGMLTSLDPHSSYLNEKSFEEMQVQTRGEFGGLGIEVTMENGLVKVVSPIDDTPAAKAGIKPGDFVSQIDKTQVMGLTLSEAVEKMRGKAGTSVVLTILREGLKEPLKVTIERAVIKIRSIRARAEDDVAYVRVTQFTESTATMMEAELKKQLKEIGPKIKGIVLDLRNNPGGLLDQAIAVSDAYLERGEIVSTRERDPRNTRRYAATAGDISNGLPIVVLINEGSASAAEIVAGALKDHKRAVVLGMKSFGKGSVQTVVPIKDHGAIRLTTARYYTPSGTSIQATGIEPDIKVEQAKVEVIKADGTLSEASLPGHLNNDQAKEGKTLPAEPVKVIPVPTIQPGKESQAASDYQLSRALDLLRAISIYKQVLPGAAPTPVAGEKDVLIVPKGK